MDRHCLPRRPRAQRDRVRASRLLRVALPPHRDGTDTCWQVLRGAESARRHQGQERGPATVARHHPTHVPRGTEGHPVTALSTTSLIHPRAERLTGDTVPGLAPWPSCPRTIVGRGVWV